MRIAKKFRRHRRVTNSGNIEEYRQITNYDRLMLDRETLTYAECKYDLKYVFSDKCKYQSKIILDCTHAYLGLPRGQRRHHPELRKLYMIGRQTLALREETAYLKGD